MTEFQVSILLTLVCFVPIFVVLLLVAYAVSKPRNSEGARYSQWIE